MKNVLLASVIALTTLQAQAREVIADNIKAKSAVLEIGGEKIYSGCFFSAVRNDEGEVSFLLSNNGDSELKEVIGQVVYLRGDLTKAYTFDKSGHGFQKFSGGVLTDQESHDGMTPASSETNLVEIQIDSKLNLGKAVLTTTKKSFLRSKTTKLTCYF